MILKWFVCNVFMDDGFFDVNCLLFLFFGLFHDSKRCFKNLKKYYSFKKIHWKISKDYFIYFHWMSAYSSGCHPHWSTMWPFTINTVNWEQTNPKDLREPKSESILTKDSNPDSLSQIGKAAHSSSHVATNVMSVKLLVWLNVNLNN